MSTCFITDNNKLHSVILCHAMHKTPQLGVLKMDTTTSIQKSDQTAFTKIDPSALVYDFKYLRHFNKHMFIAVNDNAKAMVKFRDRKSLNAKEIQFLKSIGLNIKVTVCPVEMPEEFSI